MEDKWALLDVNYCDLCVCSFLYRGLLVCLPVDARVGQLELLEDGSYWKLHFFYFVRRK